MNDPKQSESVDTRTGHIKIVSECLRSSGGPKFLGTPVADYLEALAAERDQLREALTAFQRSRPGDYVIVPKREGGA